MRGFQLGICMWGFPMQGPTGVRMAAEMGFAGAEIDLGPYENGYPLSNPRIQNEYRRVSRDFGIAITSIAVELLNRYGLTNPLDTRKGMIAMEGCRRAIDAAAQMEVPVVQLPSFNDGAIMDEEGFLNTCEKIRLLCEYAEDAGVVLATENALSIGDSLRMMEEVNSGRFGLMFDTQNYFLAGASDTAQYLRELAPHVVQIHLKDGYHRKLSSALLGTGESGFMETAQVIRETACSEWLLLENYYNQEPLSRLDADQFEIVKKDVEIVKRIFEL